MSDLALNLLSGLVGSLIGAFATLRAARWQLRQISEAHADALAHQNKILEQTFQHQHALLAAEQKLKIQLDILTQLYNVLHGVARPVFLVGHQLRNSWAEQIMYIGLENYRLSITQFRDNASNALIEFGTVLDSARHLPNIYFPFEKTLQFQAKFSEPIQLFLLALEKIPPNFERETLSLIGPNASPLMML